MPQAAVEEAGPYKARSQAGIVQALHPGQPGACIAGRDAIGRLRRVGGGGTGADEHGPRTGAGHAVQVDGSFERDAQSTQEDGQVVREARRPDDHDHPRVGAGGEGGERCGETDVRLQRRSRRARGPANSGRHQLTADDDDARPLPLVQLLRDVAAGGQRAGRGFGWEEEVAENHGPAAQRDVDPHLVDVRWHAWSIVSPSEGHRRPSWGGFSG